MRRLIANIRPGWLVAVGILVLAASSFLDRQAESQGTYKAPRTPDGRPDISGIWQALNTGSVNIQDHSAGSDGPAGHGIVVGNDLPYTPAGLKKKQENYEKRMTADPVRNCYLPGVPRAAYMPFPFEIRQTATHVAMMYEYVHAMRLVYTNNTPHQADVEWWMGDSRGKWEGESLVVEVTNHNDLTWFDSVGNHHSNKLKVVERYTRTGPDHMNYEATIEDPDVFTKPWKMSFILYRRKEPNAQIFDYQCYAFDHDKKGLSIPLSRMSGPPPNK